MKLIKNNLNLSEQIAWKIMETSLRVECLNAIAQKYFKKGDTVNGKRILLAAAKSGRRDRYSLEHCHEIATEFNITLPFPAPAKKKIRRLTPRHSFIDLTNSEITLNGRRNFLSLVSTFASYPKKFRISVPRVKLLLEKHGEPFTLQVINAMKPWPNESYSVIDDVVEYYFKKRDWRRVIKYCGMMPRDTALWSLCIEILNCKNITSDPSFKTVITFISKELGVKYALETTRSGRQMDDFTS